MKRFISGAVAAATLLSAAVFSPGTAAAEPPVLKADSSLVMAKDGTYVFGTGGAVTAEKLAAEFEGEVTVKNPAGDTIDGTKKVPTGSTVNTESGAVSVLVTGDANIDGNINLNDVSTMLKSIAKWSVSIDQSAADADVSGKINLTDVSTVLKHIAGWDVKLGNMKIVVDENPIKAANEDAVTKLWFEHSMEKLAQNDTESSDMNSYVIYAAKNEIEDANVYIAPSENKKDVTISVTEFVNSYGDTVESESFVFWYHKMDTERPDALFQSAQYKTDVSANKSQGFLIKAKTDENTFPGLYEATLSITDSTGEFKRARVYLNVWDFTLIDSDAPDTSFGLSKSTVNRVQMITTEEAGVEMYKKHYDYLLENRMCAVNLPYDITDERCDEYLSDDRVRSFLVSGSGYGGEYERTDEQVHEYYDKLSQNEEWFEKGYFYYVDEPHFEEDYNKMDVWRQYLDKNYPGGKQVVPLDSHKVIPLCMDIYERLERSVDIYCPITHMFTPQSYRGNDDYEVFNTVEFIEKNGTYEDEIKRVTAENPEKESWWYTAGRPVQPYANLHAEDSGATSRILFWQQYQYDVTGYLFYLINDYESANPLRNMEPRENSILQPGKKMWGSGILVYSAIREGVKDPVWSIRIESIRDGIEDYMYMTMAERIVGETAVKEMITAVSRNIADFDDDADKMLAIRAELANIILNADAE